MQKIILYDKDGIRFDCCCNDMLELNIVTDGSDVDGTLVSMFQYKDKNICIYKTGLKSLPYKTVSVLFDTLLMGHHTQTEFPLPVKKLLTFEVPVFIDPLIAYSTYAQDRPGYHLTFQKGYLRIYTPIVQQVGHEYKEAYIPHNVQFPYL